MPPKKKGHSRKLGVQTFKVNYLLCSFLPQMTFSFVIRIWRKNKTLDYEINGEKYLSRKTKKTVQKQINNSECL